MNSHKINVTYSSADNILGTIDKFLSDLSQNAETEFRWKPDFRANCPPKEDIIHLVVVGPGFKADPDCIAIHDDIIARFKKNLIVFYLPEPAIEPRLEDEALHDPGQLARVLTARLGISVPADVGQRLYLGDFIPECPEVDRNGKDQFERFLIDDQLVEAAEFLLNRCELHHQLQQHQLVTILAEIHKLRKKIANYEIVPTRAVLETINQQRILEGLARDLCPDLPIDILFIGVSAIDAVEIRVTRERREINRLMREQDVAKRFHFIDEWAVTMSDLEHLFTTCNPKILHFSGHGSQEGLAIERENGMQRILAAEYFAKIIELYGNDLECVILNACHSLSTGTLIAKKVPHVIWVEGEVWDEAAIQFSTSFYSSLFKGHPYDTAYKSAKIFAPAKLESSVDEIPIFKF